MKLSLKLLEQDNHQPQPHHHHHAPLLLLRAKIPITIFNLPFLSHFSTTTHRPSDLSLSLSTALPSGPSLKLSYAAVSTAPPVTLTLKSGTGVFGSPNNSPLVISAHFSFNPNSSTNPNPRFSLLVKPQLGSFSLRKSTTSHSESSITSEPTNVVDSGFDSDSNSNSFGFVPLERPNKIKDVSEAKIDKYSILKGIKLGARTVMPVGKTVALNCRWWVNFPKDDMMPVLRINKIGIQRVDDVLLKDNDDDDKKKKKSSVENGGEAEMLKGMCFWMKKELDVLRSVNREIKRDLEEMKIEGLSRNVGGGNFREGVRKKVMSGGGERGSNGFEDWRSKRNGVKEEKRVIEEKNGGSLASDVESELQRAIMAASGGGAL